MTDYYDWGPRTVLPRPLVLTGFLGARTGQVGNVLCGLTGHRHLEVDRAIEHAAGMSLAALVLEEGEASLRRHEARIVRKGLGDVPPPILSLGHTTLADRALRADVARTATLVYVEISLETALSRLARDVANDESRHFAWLAGQVPTVAVLRARLDNLRPAYEAADHVVDGNRSPGEVARDLKGLLGL